MGYVLGLVKLLPSYAHPFPQPITAGIVPDQACFLSLRLACPMMTMRASCGLETEVGCPSVGQLMGQPHFLRTCQRQSDRPSWSTAPSHAHSIRSENFVLKIAKPVQNPCSTQYVSSFSIKHITEMCPMAVRHTSDAHVIIQWWTGFRQVSDVPA